MRARKGSVTSMAATSDDPLCASPHDEGISVRHSPGCLERRHKALIGRLIHRDVPVAGRRHVGFAGLAVSCGRKLGHDVQLAVGLLFRSPVGRVELPPVLGRLRIELVEHLLSHLSPDLHLDGAVAQFRLEELRGQLRQSGR